MKAKITDSVMETMRMIALNESMHKDEEIKEAEHEEIEEAEEIEEDAEEMEEAKGDGRNLNRAGTTLGGMFLGNMAGAAAGGLAGAGIAAASGQNVGAGLSAGAGLGGIAGSVAGGVKGWKHATKQNKAMYKESLDEATLAAIVEAVTPMADRVDALNEAFDSDLLNEAELDAGIAQALAEAAIAGFMLSEMSKEEDLEEAEHEDLEEDAEELEELSLGDVKGAVKAAGKKVPAIAKASAEGARNLATTAMDSIRGNANADNLAKIAKSATRITEDDEEHLEEADGKKGSALGTAAKVAGAAAALGGAGYAASKGMLGDTAKDVVSKGVGAAKAAGERALSSGAADAVKDAAATAADTVGAKAKDVGSTISGILKGGKKSLPKGAEMVASIAKNT